MRTAMLVAAAMLAAARAHATALSVFATTERGCEWRRVEAAGELPLSSRVLAVLPGRCGAERLELSRSGAHAAILARGERIYAADAGGALRELPAPPAGHVEALRFAADEALVAFTWSDPDGDEEPRERHRAFRWTGAGWLASTGASAFDEAPPADEPEPEWVPAEELPALLPLVPDHKEGDGWARVVTQAGPVFAWHALSPEGAYPTGLVASADAAGPHVLLPADDRLWRLVLAARGRFVLAADDEGFGASLIDVAARRVVFATDGRARFFPEGAGW